MSTDCTTIPKDTATDAGVAGAGVLLAFIITAGIALLLSSIIILQSCRRPNAESRILRRLLSSLSDQQIITGIGIQAVGLAKFTTMVPYHFFIIWLLSLLSMATHLCSLLALVDDFKRDWVLRWLRQFLMFVNMVLSCVFGIYVLIANMRGMRPTLPIVCATQVQAEPASNPATSVIGTVAVIAGSVIIFVASVWYLHSQRRKWHVFIQLGGMVLLICLAIGAAVRVIMLSQAFGTPSVQLRGDTEKDWSFGQLLPMLLLLLPLVSALEIVRGEMSFPCGNSDDQSPLLENSNDRSSFQPNPFWGSQSHKLTNMNKR